MVTTESLACESIEDCTKSFSKEMTGLWHELRVLEQRLEAQRISVQSIKIEMNGNKEVPEHRGILEEDDVEERLTDSLKNDWDQHTEVLAVGSKALRPYDFYSNKCFVIGYFYDYNHINKCLSSKLRRIINFHPSTMVLLRCCKIFLLWNTNWSCMRVPKYT